MNNAEINYESSESVCRLFSIEQNKGKSFINGYEVKRDRLLKELDRLLNGKNNSFNKKSFLSSDENVAKVKKCSLNSSVDVLYKIFVKSLISCKEVVTKDINKENFNDMIKADKKVDIIIKGNNKELKISLDLLKGTSYKDAILDISNEINNSGFNLISKVLYENRKSILKLNIKGEEGLKNDFDISIKGDETLKKLLTFETIEEASDYVYEIGGKEYTSQNKEVEIAKNLIVTLIDTGYTDIISTFDVDEVISNVSVVIDKYNDLVDYLIENKNYVIISKELDRYQETLGTLLYELSVLGIDLMRTSRIALDKRTLKRKLLNDSQYASKYLIKEGGLLSKLQLLLDTSNITLNSISRSDDKKAMVMNMFGKVNGKTISHEPYFMIAQSEKNNL